MPVAEVVEVCFFRDVLPDEFVGVGQFTGSHHQVAGARTIELKENRRSFDTWIRRVGKNKHPDEITRLTEDRVTYLNTFVENHVR